jgi:hypothetical protein
MKIEISIQKIHIVCLILTLAVLTGINYAIAQTSRPDPGHSPSEIGPGTFAGTTTDTWTFPGEVSWNNKYIVHTYDFSGSGGTIQNSGGAKLCAITGINRLDSHTTCRVYESSGAWFVDIHLPTGGTCTVTCFW